MRTLIVFTIKSQRIHQMTDSGHTGQDQIDEVIERFAGVHKVSKRDVRVSFVDEDDQKVKTVSSEVIMEVDARLKRKEIRN